MALRAKVLFVFGTRPEAIKLAPVILSMRARPDSFDVHVCVTGQHREMLDEVLSLFEISPNYDLNVMRRDQSLSQLTARLFERLDSVVAETKPDWIIVQGDTTSTMVGSLMGFYHRIPIAHVEAGLRTEDRSSPFPEEINRRITDLVADLYFAPTPGAARNLLDEEVDPGRIHVTGNTAIDALFHAIKMEKPQSSHVLDGVPSDGRMILVTVHRRENHGKPLKGICRALYEIAETRNDIQVVFPVHPNPRVRDQVFEALDELPRIKLLPPLDYCSFAHLLSHSYLILTDSGGIQEEAPSLGKPVLVLRDKTERPEAVEAGHARVVGTDQLRIVKETDRLLSDPSAYREMSKRSNLFGDGHACDRICEVLTHAHRGAARS